MLTRATSRRRGAKRLSGLPVTRRYRARPTFRSRSGSCEPMDRPITVGAVVYDPKVIVIWDIIKQFFAAEGCPTECAFYSTYELQVDALMAGSIEIAWNSPLAWVDA